MTSILAIIKLPTGFCTLLCRLLRECLPLDPHFSPPIGVRTVAASGQQPSFHRPPGRSGTSLNKVSENSTVPFGDLLLDAHVIAHALLGSHSRFLLARLSSGLRHRISRRIQSLPWVFADDPSSLMDQPKRDQDS